MVWRRNQIFGWVLDVFGPPCRVSASLVPPASQPTNGSIFYLSYTRQPVVRHRHIISPNSLLVSRNPLNLGFVPLSGRPFFILRYVLVVVVDMREISRWDRIVISVVGICPRRRKVPFARSWSVCQLATFCRAAAPCLLYCLSRPGMIPEAPYPYNILHL